MNDSARVILALAAEADDEFIWNHLKVIQAEMFGAGPIASNSLITGLKMDGKFDLSSQRNGLWTPTIWLR